MYIQNTSGCFSKPEQQKTRTHRVRLVPRPISPLSRAHMSAPKQHARPVLALEAVDAPDARTHSLLRDIDSSATPPSILVKALGTDASTHLAGLYEEEGTAVVVVEKRYPCRRGARADTMYVAFETTPSGKTTVGKQLRSMAELNRHLCATVHLVEARSRTFRDETTRTPEPLPEEREDVSERRLDAQATEVVATEDVAPATDKTIEEQQEGRHGESAHEEREVESKEAVRTTVDTHCAQRPPSAPLMRPLSVPIEEIPALCIPESVYSKEKGPPFILQAQDAQMALLVVGLHRVAPHAASVAAAPVTSPAPPAATAPEAHPVQPTARSSPLFFASTCADSLPPKKRPACEPHRDIYMPSQNPSPMDVLVDAVDRCADSTAADAADTAHKKRGVFSQDVWKPEEQRMLIELVSKLKLPGGRHNWTAIQHEMQKAGCVRNTSSIRNWWYRYGCSARPSIVKQNRCRVCGELRRGHLCRPTPVAPSVGPFAIFLGK